MKVETCMSKDVQIASPAQSIRDAARVMKGIDAGFLPVGGQLSALGASQIGGAWHAVSRPATALGFST